jgi:hypothetical protein
VKTRFAAAIASVGILLATPAGALAGGSTTTTSSQITPTAPSRLTTTSTTPTTPTTVTSSPTGTTGHGATLPNTGYDLLPETLIGFALVGVGVGLKLRRSRA